MSAPREHPASSRIDLPRRKAEESFAHLVNGTLRASPVASNAMSGGATHSFTNAAISPRIGTEEQLRHMMVGRGCRSEFLPSGLFGEPAWDMLLDLYLSDIMSRRTSVSDLCAASNVPPTTALRWIGALHREGLIGREKDRLDGRRIFIRLSADGLARMDRYFKRVSALMSLPNQE